MRILGFDIHRQPPPIKASESFIARSLVNQALEVQAKSKGAPQSSFTAMIEVPNNSYGQMMRDQNRPVSADLEDRAIRSDPRELWFLSLPNKISPQQCLNILRAALGE